MDGVVTVTPVVATTQPGAVEAEGFWAGPSYSVFPRTPAQLAPHFRGPGRAGHQLWLPGAPGLAPQVRL